MPSTPPNDLSSAAAIAPGGRIGPYRVLQVLGEGGMGVVFEVEQTDPVNRRLALKIMRGHGDTESVIGRFEAERQALAVMDHAGIAKVFDAGVAESGRMYFVMELVRGIPITEYCDTEKLSTRERLNLFIAVCRAVQHAHQKGVIHRDLKPSNVLVGLQDGAPAPKIIDFGIAKAVNQRLTDRTLVTQVGQAIGTPAYMSPEQAEMSGLDVDSRTDVYSLGVMLYEILVGALPVDPEEVGMPAFIAQHVLRETDPPTPSSRFDHLGDKQDVADRRRTDPLTLRKQLRGDLDWITMMAMEHDRSRRYETPNALAQDLQRFLADEPIAARPPSAAYRFQKFVRRNRVAVGSAVAIFVVLVAGLVVTGLALLRASRAEQRAETEAGVASEVSDFLTSVFEVSDPSTARGSTLTAREVLDRGADEIVGNPTGDPGTRARLMRSMGSAYRGLGLYDRARTMFEDALRLRRDAHGDDDLEVAQSLYELGTLSRVQAQYAEAESLLTRALSIQERLAGPNDAAVATTLLALASLHHDQGQFAESEPIFVRAVAELERVHGPDHPEVAAGLDNIAQLYRSLGRLDEAESMFHRSLRIREAALGADHPDVASTLNNFAALFYTQAKYDSAEAMFRRSLAIREKVFGPNHPDLTAALGNLAVVLQAQSKYESADSMLRRDLAVREETYGPDHPAVANTLHNIAWGLQRLGRFDEAESLSLRSIEIKEEALGPNHTSVADGLNNLALLYKTQGRFDEAAPLYRRALQIREDALGPEHSAVAVAVNNLASLYHSQGRWAEAARGYRRALAIREATLGPDHPGVATTLNNIGRLEQQRGNYAQAEAMLRRSIAIYEEALGPDHRRLANPLHHLAGVYTLQHRFDDAEPLYRRALSILEAAIAPDHPDLAVVVEGYASMLRAAGREVEAAALENRH